MPEEAQGADKLSVYKALMEAGLVSKEAVAKRLEAATAPLREPLDTRDQYSGFREFTSKPMTEQLSSIGETFQSNPLHGLLQAATYPLAAVMTPGLVDWARSRSDPGYYARNQQREDQRRRSLSDAEFKAVGMEEGALSPYLKNILLQMAQDAKQRGVTAENVRQEGFKAGESEKGRASRMELEGVRQGAMDKRASRANAARIKAAIAGRSANEFGGGERGKAMAKVKELALKQDSGVPFTREDEIDLNLALALLDKPQTFTTDKGAFSRPGYGVEARLFGGAEGDIPAIPGSRKIGGVRPNATIAQNAAIANQAMTAWKKVRAIPLMKGGDVRRVFLGASQVGKRGLPDLALPESIEGARNFSVNWNSAVKAMLRLRTGANLTGVEIENEYPDYFVSFDDDPKTIADRKENIEAFFAALEDGIRRAGGNVDAFVASPEFQSKWALPPPASEAEGIEAPAAAQTAAPASPDGGRAKREFLVVDPVTGKLRLPD